MKTRSAAIILLRVLFGILCLPAGFMLLLSMFMFDDPEAAKNPLTINLAIAPLIYIALYAISLIPFRSPTSSGMARPASLLLVLLPLVGIAWFGISLLLLQVVCDGSFGCR